MLDNKNLRDAREAKNDEFYTLLEDIEAECAHYDFHDKVVYCNCDDLRRSNFYRYFDARFDELGLRGLLCTHYIRQPPTQLSLFGEYAPVEKPLCVVRYHGEERRVSRLSGDGDFRSPECVRLLEEADVVVTNPPFSLFREYVAQLVAHKKKFLIIGNQNAITYKEIFPLIAENKVWLGYRGFTGGMWYINGSEVNTSARAKDGKIHLGSVGWFTNYEMRGDRVPIACASRYDPERYPHYDNYDAINVDKVADIPCDWRGVMGVPITFLDKYDPEQFEIVGATESEGKGFSHGLWEPESGIAQPVVNGKRRYKRLFIRYTQSWIETHAEIGWKE